jgi:hypothetical protein
MVAPSPITVIDNTFYISYTTGKVKEQLIGLFLKNVYTYDRSPPVSLSSS